MRLNNLTRFLSAVLLLTGLLSCYGCYTYRMATHVQPGTETATKLTAHSFFWGLAKSPKEIRTPLCDSLAVNGMAEVTVKNNFGFALITVATLGIWSPVQLECKCGKPCPKSGTF